METTEYRPALFDAVTTLRFSVAAIAATVCSLLGAATMPGEGESSTQVAEAITDEFMKGFRAIDTDRDGEIDFTSLVRTLRSVGYGQAQPVGRGPGGGIDPFERFESLDADGDGILREDEAGPYGRRTEYFEDGEVTLDEYKKAWGELQARRGTRGGRGGGPRAGASGRSRGGGGRGGVQRSDIEFLTTLDSNRDRTLTREETHEAIQSAAAELMGSRSSLDANGDGEVTAREYALSQPRTGRPVDDDGLDGHVRGHFEREDYDRNGVITLGEIAKRASANLSRRIRALQLCLRLSLADSNEDGEVSLAELHSVYSDKVPSLLGVSRTSPLKLGQLCGELYSAFDSKTRALDEAISSN